MNPSMKYSISALQIIVAWELRKNYKIKLLITQKPAISFIIVIYINNIIYNINISIIGIIKKHGLLFILLGYNYKNKVNSSNKKEIRSIIKLYILPLKLIEIGSVAKLWNFRWHSHKVSGYRQTGTESMSNNLEWVLREPPPSTTKRIHSTHN